QRAAEHRHDREAAVVDHAVEPGDVLRFDLLDQLRPDPQARAGAQLLTGRHHHRRGRNPADEVLRAAAAAVGAQGELDLVAGIGQPGAEEVVLHERDPCVAVLALHGAVVIVAEPAARIAVFGAEPGRARQAEGLGVGHATLDVGRAAHQLPVRKALPRRGAGIDDVVAYGNRVLAALEGVGAADADTVGPLPDE